MAALLPNVNRMVERDFLIMGVQQIKYIFNIARTINIFDTGSEDIRAKTSKAEGYGLYKAIYLKYISSLLIILNEY